MRIVVAECSATYTGRLDTTLGVGVRTILVKSDGTLLLHGDTKSKPLNWMPPPNIIEKKPFPAKFATKMKKAEFRRHDIVGSEWEVRNTKTGETLHIVFHRVIHVTPEWVFDDGAALVKDGAESTMQRILSENPHFLFPSPVTLVRREYPTPIGPVDILFEDTRAGVAYAVEVKRRGHIAGVDQLARYVEFIAEEKRWEEVRGVYAAQRITPQAQVLLDRRGLTSVTLDYEELKAVDSPR